MTTRNQAIDALLAMENRLGPQAIEEVIDALDAAGLLAGEEPQPSVGAGKFYRSDGVPLFLDGPADVTESTIPGAQLVGHGSITGTFSTGNRIDAALIQTPNISITEPMPPSLIEAIEGTVWLAEHDAAIREGIATAIKGYRDQFVLVGSGAWLDFTRCADIARDWVPAEDGA